MTRGAALQLVARPVLLMLWAFVAWGSLLLLVTLGNAVDEGVRPALALLVPARGASAWTWLNALSAALALVVWLVGSGTYWARRAAEAPDDPGA